MTNYASVPAGPEMDRMIAEMVMGLQADIRKPGAWPFPECRVRDNGDPETFEQWRPFSPSTRIDHAWQAVEKMRRKEYNIDIIVRDVDADDNISVFIRENWGGSKTIKRWEAYVDAESAPLAICRAALMAMEAR